MTIHKEGYPTIALTTVFCAALVLATHLHLEPVSCVLAWIAYIIITGFWLFIISFFRLPKRVHTFDENGIISPADGKVVVIEEMVDEEYFHEKRLQISVFMSPANVHVNRNPISGTVLYSQYHKGKFLVAWDPKSSTDNERHSIVLTNGRVTLLVKQIAGALARRIVNYAKVGTEVKQNDEFGFIKFGSRVDLLLPPNAKPTVKIGDVVKGGVTVLATID
jgi:phosphatidylserine decarboxylase